MIRYSTVTAGLSKNKKLKKKGGGISNIRGVFSKEQSSISVRKPKKKKTKSIQWESY